MITVTVTGSECTGKTTLARGLAERLGAVLVLEYAREFVEQMGRAPIASDVDFIARGQLEREDAAIRSRPGILVLDTDLLSTCVYSRHYYGDCPEWIEVEARRRAADLYILCGIDVPWTADGVQRDRPHQRPKMHSLFRSELETRCLRFAELSGGPRERLDAAIAAIDEIRVP